MSLDSSPEVLVVGAGPVGLTMANELTRHGVPCRIIDANPDVSVWSKAAAVTPRTLEAFDLMGVIDGALARGRYLHGFNFHSGGKRIAHVELGTIESTYPSMMGLSQRDTEILLGAHLRGQGVQIGRPVKLVQFEQDSDGVTTTLSHSDGRQEVLRVPWMVACDGAHSSVRKGLNLAFEGTTSEQSLVQADVKIDWPFAVEEDEAQVFASPDGLIGALPLLSGGRYRLLVIPGDQMEPTLEYFQQQLDLRGPPGAVVSDPAWMIGFRFHSRLVSQYRVGRIFLAGDAAHIHSPAGAQGMNMGIQDAFNLAWKLALTIRGAATPALLDSYHLERRPVADAVVNGTDRAFKSAMWFNTLRHPLAQTLRNQLLSFLTSFSSFGDRAANAVGGAWLAYPDSPVVGQHQVSIWSSHVRSSPTVEHPGLRDWLDFGKGPGPGERAPDVGLTLDDGIQCRLFDILRKPIHTLLLFDGGAPTEEGYRHLTALAAKVHERFGRWISTHVVVPSPTRPPALEWEGCVILDADGALHQRYGARSECLYLIRPDSYVAFRSQPADGGKLMEYLATILVG